MLNRFAKFLAPAIVAAAFFGFVAVQLSFNAEANEPRALHASETKDWGSLVDGAGAAEDVTVSTAVMGDYCIASMSVDVVDMILTCNVTAAGVATAHMQNETAGTVDLASGTLRITVIRKAAL